MISSCQQLEQAALDYGLLPFFSNNIPGFSVEEMTAPGMLFGDNSGDDGCWEWKGPVIREMTTAYGKFFRRKAGFVSLDLYPHFINYRRHAYPLEPGSIEATLLSIISDRESATSAELREMIFGKPSRKKALDKGGMKLPGRQALEAPLQRLQMGGRLLIADFMYKYTVLGERYGWGVALYTTPELWFGKDIARIDCAPDQSLKILTDHLASRLPGATEAQIIKLLS